MYKKYIAAFSLAMLAVATLIWRDLFLFSKILYAPAWVNIFPDPIWAIYLIVAICLMPMFFVYVPTRQSAMVAVRVILWAPIPALAYYFITHFEQKIGDLFLNAAFNYLWVVVCDYAIPASALWILHYVCFRGKNALRL